MHTETEYLKTIAAEIAAKPNYEPTHLPDKFLVNEATDSPKRSIRHAIGQVMEYAYYPGLERAQILYVVGDREPEADSVVYLAYLRERFGLPVWYRYFDWDTMLLSEPY